MGLGRQHLGRPVDKNFQFFTGPAARSLFVYDEGDPADPNAAAADPCAGSVQGVFCTAVNSMEHRTVAFEDSRSFAANISGLQIGPVGVGGGIGIGSERRYATYQAFQLLHCLEVDDAATLRAPPKEATYYVKRICYGRMYNVVLEGSSSNFNAGVKASYMTIQGSIDVFARSNNLQVTTQAKGLEPVTNEAIFARTSEEIQQHYKQSGTPAAIFVEYQAIPDTCVPTAQLIDWQQPVNMLVELKSLRVYKKGRDRWTLDAKARKNGEDLWLDNRNILNALEVDDDCTSDDRNGPDGDRTFCEYSPGWSARLQPIAGDKVYIDVEGTAIGGSTSRPVLKDGFELEIGATNENKCGTIGKSDGTTSYLLDWCVSFPAN